MTSSRVALVEFVAISLIMEEIVHKMCLAQLFISSFPVSTLPSSCFRSTSISTLLPWSALFFVHLLLISSVMLFGFGSFYYEGASRAAAADRKELLPYRVYV